MKQRITFLFMTLASGVKLINSHHDLHRQALFEQRAYFFGRNLWTG